MSLLFLTLRAKGFKGSLPHFRRVGNGATEVLTFQFDRHGGGFVMQIGRCSDRGFTTHLETHTTAGANRLDLAPNEKRIQPRDLPGTDGWFRFDSGLFHCYLAIRKACIRQLSVYPRPNLGGSRMSAVAA